MIPGTGESASLCWARGAVRPLESALPAPDDRAFRYGDGVFCTLAVRRGLLLDTEAQVERLIASAGAIGLSVPDPVSSPEGLCSVLRQLGAGDATDAVVRIQVSAGTGGRGYARGEGVHSWELVEILPIPPARNVTIAILPESESCLSPLPAVKSCNALPHVLCAAAAARLGVTEAVRTTGGLLLEASASNLFWVADRTLFTPSAELPLYPGVTRGVVLEVARAAGWKVEEGAFPTASVGEARSVFLTNAVRGVEPVAAVDGRPTPWPEELEALRGEVERFREAHGLRVSAS